MDTELVKHSYHLRLLELNKDMNALARRISLMYGYREVCITLAICLLEDILWTPLILDCHSLITYAEGVSIEYTDKMDMDLFFYIFNTRKRSRAKILLALTSKIDSDWKTLRIRRPHSYIEVLYNTGDSKLIRELMRIIV